MISGNPYVGPRPLSKEDPIFGRERELRELVYLLTAERIVLLHSPSGAGKSSLINAQGGLVQQLLARFDVWLPTRVNLPPPAGLNVANRYAWSAAVGFEHELPEDRRRAPEMFASTSLADYVKDRPRRNGAPKNIVLIFDQFEEVLRVDPLNVEEKRAFFHQLGDLLLEPSIWALFVLREDYLAPLDPYSRLVPTHLHNRYRIDLLKVDQAQEAIEKTAPSGGREFTEPAVEKLLNDLSTVHMQQADGSVLTEKGMYIEPLQLQVVCRSLWEQMEAEDLVIDLEDVEAFGNVTKALSAFYAGAVKKVAGEDIGLEWTVRDWMGEKLITPDGLRGQVQRSARRSEGLDNALIQQLVDTHLVRAEQRGGSVWYELAHDRLIQPIKENNDECFQGLDIAGYYSSKVAAIAGGDVSREREIREWVARLITAEGVRARVQSGGDGGAAEILTASYFLRSGSRKGSVWFELAHDRLIEPIRKSNREWFEAKLSPFEKRADQWEQEGRPDSLLYIDDELRAAGEWAAANSASHAHTDRFLAACRARQGEIDNERRTTRRLRYALIAAFLGLVAAAYGFYDAKAKETRALIAEQEAKDLQKTAEEAKTAAQQSLEKLLATIDQLGKKDQQLMLKDQADAIKTKLFQDKEIEFTKHVKLLQAQGQEAANKAELANIQLNQMMETQKRDAVRAAEDARAGLGTKLIARQNSLPATASYVPVRLLLTAESAKMQPSHENLDMLRKLLDAPLKARNQDLFPRLSVQEKPASVKASFGFSPIVTTILDAGFLRVFRTADGSAFYGLKPPFPSAFTAVSPNGLWLGMCGGARAAVVEVGKTEHRGMETPDDKECSAVAVSADGRLLAAAQDKALRVTNLNDKSSQGWQLFSTIRALAFSPDGKSLAAADGQVMVFVSTSDWKASVKRFPFNVTALAFSSDSKLIAFSVQTTQPPSAPPGVIMTRVIVQDTTNQNVLANLNFSGPSEVKGVLFGPQNKEVAALVTDGTTVSFPSQLVSAEELINLACAQAGRNFTVAEWTQMVNDGPPRKTCPSLPDPK